MLAPWVPRALVHATLAALLALLAACNGGIEVPAGPPAGQDRGSQAGADNAEDGGGGGGPPGGDRPGSATTRTTARASSPSGDRPGGGDDDGPAASTGGPGSFAGALLGAGSQSLVVEVLAQEGAAPRGPTVSHLTSVLGDVSGKQVTTERRAVPGGARTWSAADLRSLADRHAGAGQGGGQVVVRLLFLHGRFTDEQALGVAVRGDLAAVFVDQVERTGGLLTGAGAIEDAVTMHEVGHLLGLVDLVLKTGRADPEHPNHSSNRSSVMYWAVESTLITDVLTGGPPRDFDDRDRADLAAIRRSS